MGGQIGHFTTHYVGQSTLFQRLSPDQHGKSDPPGKSDDADNNENGLFKLPVPQSGHQYQKQKKGGETHEHLHQTHHSQIHHIAVISGSHPHGGADDDGKECGNQTDSK